MPLDIPLFLLVYTFHTLDSLELGSSNLSMGYIVLAQFRPMDLTDHLKHEDVSHLVSNSEDVFLDDYIKLLYIIVC